MTDVGTAPREAVLAEALASAKVRGGVIARERLLMRLGVAVMVVGVGLALFAYNQSFNATLDAEQRDALVLAVAGVALSVVGAAVFLRYSIGALLRFWLARLVLERDRSLSK